MSDCSPIDHVPASPEQTNHSQGTWPVAFSEKSQDSPNLFRNKSPLIAAGEFVNEKPL